MSLIVSDTSPLRAVTHVGLAWLPSRLFGDVVIPPVVAAELAAPSLRAPPLDALLIPGVRIQAPTDEHHVARLCKRLDRGEAEAIVLALELGTKAVLMDERDGRLQAAKLGLLPVGFVGMLQRAKAAGLVAQIGPLVRRVQHDINFSIADEVLNRVLRDAGEI